MTRGRGRAVVVLPQWNSDAGGHIGLSRLLARFGVSALRLSLPYHDARMPPELTRADYIVSSNIARTVQVCRQAVLDARRAVAVAGRSGVRAHRHSRHQPRLVPVAADAAHEPQIRAQALNHVSPWFADVVWRGLSTQPRPRRTERPHRSRTAAPAVAADQPVVYLDRVRDTRTLLVYARYDLTFPVDLSQAAGRRVRDAAACRTKSPCCPAAITAAGRRRSSSSTATC